MGILSWMSYTYFGTWLNGRIDGKKGIPSAKEGAHSPYEEQLTLIAEENIRRVAQKWLTKTGN